LASNHKIQFL